MSAIRAQRCRVHGATDAALAGYEIPRRIRRSPLRWLLGAGLVGVVAGRLVVPPIVRSGRRQLQRSMHIALHERLRTTLTAAVVAAVGRFAWSGSDGAAQRAGAPAPAPADRPDSSDPALSTQRPTS